VGQGGLRGGEVGIRVRGPAERAGPLVDYNIQGNFAKAASNLSYCPSDPKSLHSKRDFDPFSRVCTAKPRDTDKCLCHRSVDCNSLHVMHSV